MFSLSCVIDSTYVIFCRFLTAGYRFGLLFSPGRPPCMQLSHQLENRLFSPPPPLAMLSLGATGTHSQAFRSRVLCCRLQANQAKVTFLPIIYSADNQNYNCIHVFEHTEVILHNCGSGRLHLKHKITEPVSDPTTKQVSTRLFLPFDLWDFHLFHFCSLPPLNIKSKMHPIEIVSENTFTAGRNIRIVHRSTYGNLIKTAAMTGDVG